MIKDKEYWEKFENSLPVKEMTLEEKLELYDQMFKWAVEIGALPLKDPLEGIEKDIKLAKWFKKLSEKNGNRE